MWQIESFSPSSLWLFAFSSRRKAEFPEAVAVFFWKGEVLKFATLIKKDF